MNYPLWKYFFDDDVDNFRQYLARATFDRNASKPAGGAHSTSLKAGSPSTLATSPKPQSKFRKGGGNVVPSTGRGQTIILTRSDINARDGFGRTLLHHAASSPLKSAIDFVRSLIEIPLVDLYVQDAESGWTALHRALYSGNIAVAQALMLRDTQNATDYTTNISHTNAGGLVKIKDHEGNSPFEVFGLTTAPRDLQQYGGNSIDAVETASVQSLDADDSPREFGRSHRVAVNSVDLYGDEVFAFGSNKNITLGLGDGDDRQFPERVQLIRPQHLLHRFHSDLREKRCKDALTEDLASIVNDLFVESQLPAVVSQKPIVVQDVVMSKLHTAILTRDPISNLHICGFGPGGRLGTGDEATRFSYVCIQGGGLAKRRVAAVALGQDHSVAVCSSGEVFTWGSNKYGQLGYELPDMPVKDTPLQLTPRQIYGLIKKEQIIGAAASSMHSAIFTSSGLYTFGKNEGQLGLMDADARSLEVQVIPRRVGVSTLQSAIQSVSAIDRATTILLENHEVIVFTNYAWTKVIFPLDGFGSDYVSTDFFNRHNRQTKHICKVTAGGNTICAMTSYGEVYTLNVPVRLEPVPANKSTTNPTKAKNALPTPSKVWSIRKSHMAATDAAVGQDGSIILCTSSGTVWKKEKRANIKVVKSATGAVPLKPKDYKFVRVPNIFGTVAVRSNAFGAFHAIRKDCEVMKEQIVVEPPKLWTVFLDLMPFKDYKYDVEDQDEAEPDLRFWKPATKDTSPATIRRSLLMNPKAEEDFLKLSQRYEPLSTSDYDVWISSNVTEVRIPVHSLLLKARSHTLRAALSMFPETYYFSVPDVLSIEYGSDGQVHLHLHGADFLTIVNLVLYMYTDQVLDVWRYTSRAVHLAPRYRQVRTELMKIANALDLKQLEKAVRIMDVPAATLREDFEIAFHDSDLFCDADVVVDLADGEERYAHSVMLRSRCPFFEGLFGGHTGGMWMANRIHSNETGQKLIHVDLTHIDTNIFEIILRHIYADTTEELFDSIVTKDLDEFMDIVIEVMAAANELMLDRLARVCQKMIGYYITPRTVCGLLNTIAESSEVDFKQAALEYIGLDLENMLEQGFLEELDEYLLEELDETVQANQTAFMPFARSERALKDLLEQDLGLAERIEKSRQTRLDSMRLPSRYIFESVRPLTRTKSYNEDVDKMKSSAAASKHQAKNSEVDSPAGSPAILPREAREELPFEMDDDRIEHSTQGLRGRGSVLPMPLKRRSSSNQPLIDPEDDVDDHDASSFSTTPQTPQTPQLMGFPQIGSNESTTMKVVWTKQVGNTPILGLKDIMQQDSSVKVSNLTQSLQQASSAAGVPFKMSQKERKRQQQQRTKSEMDSHESREVSRTETSSKTLTYPAAVAKSPWQTIAKAIPPRPLLAVTQADNPQTLGNSRNSLPVTERTPQKAKTDPKQKSTEKSPQAVSSFSSSGMSGVSRNPPPQIQSIRHTPAPVRSSSWLDARTSMADILSQQQYEKIAVKENIAKRSLHEIQQEQEFQEWWDNESRKVQEQEAAANVAATRKSRGERIRGGNRRKASDRGGVNNTDQIEPTKIERMDAVVQSSNNVVEGSQDRKAEHGRLRGRGGGRGEGRSVSNKT